jgi:hypothetical protein
MSDHGQGVGALVVKGAAEGIPHAAESLAGSQVRSGGSDAPLGCWGVRVADVEAVGELVPVEAAAHAVRVKPSITAKAVRGVIHRSACRHHEPRERGMSLGPPMSLPFGRGDASTVTLNCGRLFPSGARGPRIFPESSQPAAELRRR